MGKRSFWNFFGMVFNFQPAQWTMPSSATISNHDIPINLGYHGNLKNVSFRKKSCILTVKSTIIWSC